MQCDKQCEYGFPAQTLSHYVYCSPVWAVAVGSLKEGRVWSDRSKAETSLSLSQTVTRPVQHIHLGVRAMAHSPPHDVRPLLDLLA